MLEPHRVRRLGERGCRSVADSGVHFGEYDAAWHSSRFSITQSINGRSQSHPRPHLLALDPQATQPITQSVRYGLKKANIQAFQVREMSREIRVFK